MTTEKKITDIEEQLTELQQAQATLRQELARARFEQWKGRIEDLEVQVHLATMDGNERLERLTEELRNSWERSWAQVDNASSTASAVAETLFAGLENAYRDVRQALLDSRRKISQ